MPTLLRIYHHLQTHASATVTETLDNLSDTLHAHPDDAAALRDARHRLTRLFSSLLHHLHTLPQDHHISKNLLNQLLARFDKIATEVHVSDPGLDAVHIAIRTVTVCKHAVRLVRAKYAQLVPDDESPLELPVIPVPTPHIHLPKRPLKHYITHFNRLLAVSAADVQKAQARLLRYRTRLIARGEQVPAWNVPTCRAIERAIFHVARYHVHPGEDDTLVVDPRAMKAFPSSVARKMTRAGFPEKFVQHASNLVSLMANDDDVVVAVVDWSKKRLDRLATDGSALCAGGHGAVVSAAGGRRHRRGSAGSLEAMRLSRVTDASGVSRGSSSGGGRRRDSDERSTSRSRSSSRSSSSSESRRRYDSHSQSAGSSRSGRFDGRDGRSNSSRKSFEERLDDGRLGGGQDAFYPSRNGASAHGSAVSVDGEPLYTGSLGPNPFDSPPGPSGGAHRFGEDGLYQGEDPYGSGDTSRSQWARVQMEKDMEQERERFDQLRYNSPERRSRQTSPLPSHHGYGRRTNVAPQSGHNVEGSVNGSARSGPVMFSRHLQGARNSVDGGESSRRESVDFNEDANELDDGDSAATDETVRSHSIDGEDEDEDEGKYGYGYQREMARRDDIWKDRQRSPSPYPGSASRGGSFSHRSNEGSSKGASRW